MFLLSLVRAHQCDRFSFWQGRYCRFSGRVNYSTSLSATTTMIRLDFHAYNTRILYFLFSNGFKYNVIHRFSSYLCGVIKVKIWWTFDTQGVWFAGLIFISRLFCRLLGAACVKTGFHLVFCFGRHWSDHLTLTVRLCEYPSRTERVYLLTIVFHTPHI